MKKNLARSIVLGLLTVSVCSVANAETVTVTTYKQQSMDQTSGDYSVNWTSVDSAGSFLLKSKGGILKCNASLKRWSQFR